MIAKNEVREAKKRDENTGRKPKNTQRTKPDPNAVPEPYSGPTVAVKMRVPVSGFLGTPSHRGAVVNLPPDVAEKYVADGSAVYYETVPLKDAIRAIKAAGGQISCEADNHLLIQACEELGAAEGQEPEGVTMENTKSEIQAFCTKQGVEFSRDDTKAELLAKLAGE